MKATELRLSCLIYQGFFRHFWGTFWGTSPIVSTHNFVVRIKVRTG